MEIQYMLKGNQKVPLNIPILKWFHVDKRTQTKYCITYAPVMFFRQDHAMTV